MRRNRAHSVSDCVGKEWRLPSKDTAEGGMLVLCVEEEKTENQVHDGAESESRAWNVMIHLNQGNSIFDFGDFQIYI